MRRTATHMQGGAQAAQPPNECGRASQRRRARHFGGTPCPEVAMPESAARICLDKIPHAENPMRKALLHERAATFLLEADKLDDSLRQAQEAHTLFMGIRPGEAQKFRNRFSRLLRSKSKGEVAVEFFDLLGHL